MCDFANFYYKILTVLFGYISQKGLAHLPHIKKLSLTVSINMRRQGKTSSVFRVPLSQVQFLNLAASPFLCDVNSYSNKTCNEIVFNN